MVRKLALAVSIAMGTLPLNVLGLGLGGIQTSSALNENYVGEIQLLSVPEGELETLRVQLASSEDFAKAGLDRPFVLSRLKFMPAMGKGGKPVIKVSSAEPVNEPFIDFLLEVNWPNGRMLREYTVLLDPPATTKRKAPAIATAKAGTATPSKSQSAARGTYSGGQYGPVESADTLWDIALAVKSGSVSVHQMMMALLKANPDAFIRGNVNRLKKGAILRVPDVDEAANISRQEALAQFQAQSQGMAKDVAAQQPKAAADTTAKSATVEEDASRLRIAAAPSGADAGTSEGRGDLTAEISRLQAEIVVAREAAATSKLENDEMQSQISSLEHQVVDLNRLLSLKDDQLAQMQADAAARQEQQPAPVAQEAAPTAQDADVVPPEPVAESKPVEPAPVVEQPKMEEAPVAVVTPEPVPVAETKPEAPEKPIKSKRKASWFEQNETLVYGAGGAIALALLVSFLSRRRKEPGEQQASSSKTVDVESILMDDVPSTSAAQAVAPAAGVDHDTSFLSEYSTEELKALQEDTAEVDPVSEADVYVAYGRYQQALNILQEALTNENTNHTAIRYKMLEVYFATQSRDQFLALAKEMVESGQIDETSSEWQHVKTMGRDLDKGNPLFREGILAVDAVSELNSKLKEDDHSHDSEISLDLSKLAEELDSAIGEDTQPIEGLESLELDLSRFKLEAASEPAKPEDSGLSELDVLDAGDETELHTQMADMSELADLQDLVGEDNKLDDDLADVSSELQGIMADSVILDEPLALDEVEAFGGIPEHLEPDQSVEATNTATVSDFDDFGPESVLGAEAETKLELAQAYMEMGDREGALSILMEVEEDGTDEQREAAVRMLAKLNA